LKPIPIDFKEPEPLVKEFADNEFWKSPNVLENFSIDDLLADYQ
jgi:hypothetical protein